MTSSGSGSRSELAGRVALVTGASRGIGRAIALSLADAGCAVGVNYNASREKAEAVVREIAEAGGRALAVRADVSREDDVRRLVEAVEDGLGPVDVLVNNAGVLEKKPLAEITLEDFERTIATNLTSAFLVTQAVVGGMRQRRWGRIIMLSSIAAQTGGVIGPQYASSKAGMLGMMHSYASLLAKEGVTANAIAPALVETEMVTNNPAARPDMLPVGRFGLVEEVAQAAVLLATNGYITGQTINLNGGWYMS